MKININSVEPGMIAKRNIYEKNKTYPLIVQDSIITEFDLAKLKSRGVKSIHVKTNGEIEENSTFVLYDYIRESYNNLDYIRILELSREIASKVLINPYPVLNLNHYFRVDENDFMHKFNICMMSTFIASVYNKQQIHSEKMLKLDYLAAASILLDIGKKYKSSEIFKKTIFPRLNKTMFPGYEDSMFLKYDERLYPLYTYTTLNKISEIPSALKNIFLYLNEREDGKGLLRVSSQTMKSDDKNEIVCAKILNIARQYDYLLNYVIKNEISVKNIPVVLRQAVKANGLSSELVEMFLQYIPLYSKGTRVLLSNGDIGFIEQNNLKFVDKPIIRLENPDEIIDLCKQENISIDKIIELEILKNKNNSLSR